MMRVTNGMIARHTRNYIQEGMQKLARTQEMMSTSKKITRLSDDPTALSQLLDVKSSMEMNKQYMRNIQDGLSYLEGADTALGTAGDLLKEAQTYAIQAANGTLNNDDMAAIGEQIDKMIDELVDIANTTVGGKYIFAGTDNNRPPFKRAGDTITYHGNLERVYREILEQTNYAIDVPSVAKVVEVDLGNPLDGGTGIGTDETAAASDGKIIINDIEISFNVGESYDSIADKITSQVEGVWAVFSDNGAGNQNTFIIKGAVPSISISEENDNTFGTNTTFQTNTESDDNYSGLFGYYDNTGGSVSGGIFDVLTNLKDRLMNGDLAGVQQSISEIDNQIDHLLRFRVQVGARTNHFESVRDQLQDQEFRLTQVMSNLEDVDLARVSIDLAQQQLTYQSSLAAGAQILQVTLLDFLK